jgi:RNA polymerase sigma-70 factor, ECF subfamily
VTETALERLVQAHQAGLWRYLRYLGAADALADDLAQEVFLVAFRHANPPPEDAPARCFGWLRAIGRNLFLAHCRKARANVVRADPQALEEAEAVWAEAADDGGEGRLEALRACLAETGGRGRELLRMAYAEERPRAEIAATAGMTEEGVKSALRRLRAALAECIRRRRK